MPQTLAEWALLLFAASAFLTLGWKHWQQRKRQLPPSAKNDIKARRLWMGDPQAYERKFGDIDRQMEESAKRTANIDQTPPAQRTDSASSDNPSGTDSNR